MKRAQKDLYRLIAGMSRAEKIDAGAYVYFTFLRPFARVAGVEDELDWTVPRDSLDLYEALSIDRQDPRGHRMPDPDVPYYTPLALTPVTDVWRLEFAGADGTRGLGRAGDPDRSGPGPVRGAAVAGRSSATG